ncbi:MAG TPA: protein TolQ [Myxococcota bacterium]|nr:protein TolQ [Myxococcota bacterium]
MVARFVMNALYVASLLLGQTPPAPAVAPPSYGFIESMVTAGLPEKAVMVLLIIFSVVSWAIIYFKWRTIRRAYGDSESFLDMFWSSKRLDAIYQKSDALPASPVSQVFRAGYVELAKLKKKEEPSPGGHVGETALGDLESVERSMRRTAAAELTGLESMIPFLATVASSSPFIGLLGTVVGIMTSFQDIGRMGNANLATVAPGIGGALVATAFGLFAAIPAVIAYNFFVAKIRVLDTEMQNFSADFLNIIKRHFF